MSETLAPITQQKFKALDSRRSYLLGTRGICITVCVAVAALLTAIAIDYFWLVEGTARWVLSGFCYALSLASFCLATLLPLRRRWTTSAKARLIEERHPELKEQILPAVELNSSIENGSPQFRKVVIDQAESAIQPISIRSILPFALIRHWFMAALLLLCGFLLLLALSGSNLRQHLARVLLPGADLGRPSPSIINVLSPTVSEQSVAPNEVIEFSVEIDRPVRWKDRPVQLQLKTEDQIQTISLQVEQAVGVLLEQGSKPSANTDRLGGRSTQRFWLNQPLTESTQYRFVADGAMTVWNNIDVQPRPSIKQYKFTLQYPEYAATPDLTVTSENGDLSAVAGSILQLGIEADQVLSQGKVHWQDAQTGSPTPVEIQMTSEDGISWQHETKINDNVMYRFEGQSRRSKLISDLGQRQRISVQADAAPTITWTQPTTAQQTISPQAQLSFAASLVDEFPLESLAFMYRIDRKSWKLQQELTVAEFSMDPHVIRHPFQQSWNLDLLPLKLREGQLLEVKLIATDRKNQSTHSATRAFLLSGVQLDSELSDHLRQRIALVPHVRDFAQQMQDWAENKSDHQWKANAADVKSESKITSLQQFAKLNRLQSLALSEKIKTALQAEPNPAISLQYLRILDYLEHSANSLETEANSLQSKLESGSDLAADVIGQRVQTAIEKSIEQHQDFATRFAKQVEHEILDDLGDDLHTALQFANDVKQHAQTGQNAIGSKTWHRQFHLLSVHLRNVTDKLLSHKSVVPEQHQQNLEEWARWSAQTADRVDNMIDADWANSEQVQTDSQPTALSEAELVQQQQQVINELAYHQNISQIAGDSSQQALQSNTHWRQLSGTPAENLQRVTDAFKRLSSHETESTDSDLATIGSLQNQLAQRRSNQYLKLQPGGAYAADLGNASRAIGSMLRSHNQATTADQWNAKLQHFQKLPSAMKVLELAHHLDVSLVLLSQLQDREQFRRRSYGARNESPRQWDVLDDQLNQAHELAGPAGLPDDLRNAISQLRWGPEVSQVRQFIPSRRWDSNQDASAVSALDQLRLKIQETETLLQPAVDQARKLFAEASPSISELARDAARQAQQLEAKSKVAAEEQREAGIPDLAQRMERQFSQQFHAQAAHTQLSEKLRDTASAMDLLEENQRSIARDADLGQAITQRIQDRITQSMAQASRNESSAAEDLDQLAVRQQQAASALETLAKHFDNIDQRLADPNALENQNDALAETARQLQAADDDLEDRYQQAEDLAKLADADQDQLLQQLEAELKRSQPMQAELDDISRNIAQQSKDQLQQAADDERRISIDNENSDQQFQFEKEQLKKDIDALASEALDIAHRVHHNATDSARRLDQSKSAEELQNAAHQLYEAANEARRVNARQPLNELQETADKLAEAAKELAPKIQNLQEQANQQAGEMPHEDENQWKRAQNEMKRIQEQIQQDDVRRAEQFQRQNERELQSEQRQLEQTQIEQQRADKAVAEAEKRQQAEPDAQWLKDQLRDRQIQQAEAKQKQQLAEASVKRQEQRLQQATAKSESTGKRPQAELEGQNPTAEMAEALAQRLQKQTDALSKSAEKLGQDQSWQQQLQTSRRQLNHNQQRQGQVNEAVQQVSKDLQRAAQHQQRLGQEQSSKDLQQLANKVDHTAQQQIAPAQNSMQQAAQTPNPAEDRQASAEQSNQIQQQLGDAREALTQHVQQLNQHIDPPTGQEQSQSPNQQQANRHNERNSSDQSNTNSQSSLAENSALQSLSPADKAKMLDQLSQAQQNSASQQASSQNVNASNQQQANLPQTLADAAAKLASRMNQLRQSQAPTQQQSLRQRMASTMAGQQANAFQQTEANPTGAAAQAIRFDSQDIDGNWSQLRQQAAEDVVETRRELVAPRYRQQVENYFKILSQQRK